MNIVWTIGFNQSSRFNDQFILTQNKGIYDVFNRSRDRSRFDVTVY